MRLTEYLAQKLGGVPFRTQEEANLDNIEKMESGADARHQIYSVGKRQREQFTAPMPAYAEDFEIKPAGYVESETLKQYALEWAEQEGWTPTNDPLENVSMFSLARTSGRVTTKWNVEIINLSDCPRELLYSESPRQYPCILIQCTESIITAPA